MVKDKKAKALLIDFSTLSSKGLPCADIDAVHIVNKYIDKYIGGFTVFVEAKNEMGTFGSGQKFIYEHLCDCLSCGAATIFATHDKTWQNGDESVDLAECKVKEVYYEGKWWKWRKDETVAVVMKNMLTNERLKRNGLQELSEIQESKG